jgi:hypothetical protein
VIKNLKFNSGEEFLILSPLHLPFLKINFEVAKNLGYDNCVNLFTVRNTTNQLKPHIRDLVATETLTIKYDGTVYEASLGFEPLNGLCGYIFIRIGKISIETEFDAEII